MKMQSSFLRIHSPLATFVVFIFGLTICPPFKAEAQTIQWLNKYPNNSEGGLIWNGVEPDGTVMWGWDINGDNRFEKYKLILQIPNKPAFEVFVWDKDQNNFPEGYAWGEAGTWIEKVWDGDQNGTYEYWCSYVNNEPVRCGYATITCNLAERNNNFQQKYREYLEAQRTGNRLVIRRAYLEYQRADLTFKACKAILLSNQGR